MAMTEIVISSLFEFVPFTSPLTGDLYYVSYPVRAIRVNDLVFHSGMGFVPEWPYFFQVAICFHRNQISGHRMPKVYTFFLDSNFFRVLKITQETDDTASLRTTETNIGLKN